MDRPTDRLLLLIGQFIVGQSRRIFVFDGLPIRWRELLRQDRNSGFRGNDQRLGVGQQLFTVPSQCLLHTLAGNEFFVLRNIALKQSNFQFARCLGEFGA
jgi:hypothetical protein